MREVLKLAVGGNVSGPGTAGGDYKLRHLIGQLSDGSSQFFRATSTNVPDSIQSIS